MVRQALEVVASLSVLLSALLGATDASAFCGFYVAKADAKLFNEASQVVLVRDGDKTVLTMVNDYKGSLKEFAIVVPVPTPITREQIHIGEKNVVDHLDQFTSVRLVEYFDTDPCARPKPRPMRKAAKGEGGGGGGGYSPREERGKVLGVTIEAQYTVGEYDILILSAKQSDGLETWLREEGYKIPDGATDVLGSYIKQKMKFFVAKVNLAEHDKLGGGLLRPIQVAYESPKFMLPIRLGTVNAVNGKTQDVILYTITKTNGAARVESTNYRTVKLPSNVDVPEYTQQVFSDFYKSMFANTAQKNEMKAVITEYAWDMSWCDPCAADPLKPAELKSLGVFWTEPSFVTRLHVRYDRERFPEDLVFQTTNDRQNFQGRYIMRHPFKGTMQCPAANAYRQRVYERQTKEAETLADLTGWKLGDIRKRMNLGDKPKDIKWYEQIWK